MKVIASLVFLLLNIAVFAGDGAGNGDAVTCTQNGGTTYQMLDIFEAPAGYQLSLGGSTLSVTDKTQFAIDRIKNLDPTRYARYSTMAQTFLQKSRIVQGPLFDFHDTGPIVIPANCELVQVAVQRPPIDPSDQPFTIDMGLWTDLGSDDARATVLLHEIIYNETLSLGQDTSQAARKFTRLLASDALDKMTSMDYGTVVSEVFESHQPEFVSDTIQESAAIGKKVSISLLKLLKNNPNHVISWETTSDKPAWLSLDTSSFTLAGTPSASDIGASNFRIIASDEAGAAMALIELEVTN